ncbi:MAG: glycoside hydrolase family 127 protein, partial [Bacteroidales bacterium]|nr:glycoside hydrolase family 127 protein [Bacteroidales bacterium]
KPEIQVVDKPDLLYGVRELKIQAQSLSINEKGLLETKNVTLTLIPYYAWLHRGSGEMAVWLPQEVSAVTPAAIH